MLEFEESKFCSFFKIVNMGITQYFVVGDRYDHKPKKYFKKRIFYLTMDSLRHIMEYKWALEGGNGQKCET